MPENPNDNEATRPTKTRREFLKYSVGASAVVVGATSLQKLPAIIRSFPKSERYSFSVKSNPKLTMWHVLAPSVAGSGFPQLKALAAALNRSTTLTSL